VLAVIGAIVGEFVGAQAGLGYLILQRNFSMDAAGMFAILIVLSPSASCCTAMMKAIARRADLLGRRVHRPLPRHMNQRHPTYKGATQ
jgi:ABC-type nitrate/sulfonate/bicarbonate transport system permease component